MTLLTAHASEIRSLHAVLKSIGFSKCVQTAILHIREAGLQLSVEVGLEMVANAYIPSSYFDEYTYNSDEESISMEISISSLIETMNIYGTATFTSDLHSSEQGGLIGTTQLKLSYEGYGYPLVLDIPRRITPPLDQQDGSIWAPMTTVELKIYDRDDRDILPFDHENLQMKVIMHSGWLLDALSALDPHVQVLTLTSPADASRNAAALRLSAISETASLEFDFPETEMAATREDGPIDSISRWIDGIVSEKYKASHLMHALKAIQASHKTSLRINDDGVLSLQAMVLDAHKKQAFVDFVCRPVEADEDDF
ncbi:hypothetical protein E3Q19_03024 [Wallemia mellicola]|nr:hypothetical protein E3Q19_03024 [Wallemia mellicola]